MAEEACRKGTLYTKPQNGDYAGFMNIIKEFPLNFNRVSKDLNPLIYNDSNWSDTL